MEKYQFKVEVAMKLYFDSLNEKDRRRYAAVETLKLGWGAQQYIAEILDIDPKTIARGIEELQNNCLPLTDRIREEGGGRKKIIETTENIDEIFFKVIATYTAGDPMNEDVKWTNLTHKEIAELMTKEGIEVSAFVVKQLLEKHGFVRRKLSKKKTMKEDKDRDAQFKNISQLIAEYKHSFNPVVSVDTKKTEQIGNFYRDGYLYAQGEIKVDDHDFSSFGSGPIIPHGIYDLKANEGYVSIGTSKDTTQFCCDNIKAWWIEVGQFRYPNATHILIIADGGGSNSSRYYIFKEDLQRLSNELGIEIRMAHYPPYTSKYNPIEHRLFCHITRACQGVVFKSVDVVKDLISKTKTSTGLNVITRINEKIYETGRKASEAFRENMPIIFDDFLGKWNYRAVPQI